MAGISAEEKAARAAEAKAKEPSEIDDLKAQIDELKKLVMAQPVISQGAQAVSAPVPLPEVKKVPVMLFKDNDRYVDDVFVSVNGEAFQIQRGELVYVPDYVKEVLDRSYEHDMETMKRLSELSTKYEATLKN